MLCIPSTGKLLSFPASILSQQSIQLSPVSAETVRNNEVIQNYSAYAGVMLNKMHEKGSINFKFRGLYVPVGTFTRLLR